MRQGRRLMPVFVFVPILLGGLAAAQVWRQRGIPTRGREGAVDDQR